MGLFGKEANKNIPPKKPMNLAFNPMPKEREKKESSTRKENKKKEKEIKNTTLFEKVNSKERARILEDLFSLEKKRQNKALKELLKWGEKALPYLEEKMSTVSEKERKILHLVIQEILFQKASSTFHGAGQKWRLWLEPLREKKDLASQITFLNKHSMLVESLLYDISNLQKKESQDKLEKLHEYGPFISSLLWERISQGEKKSDTYIFQRLLKKELPLWQKDFRTWKERELQIAIPAASMLQPFLSWILERGTKEEKTKARKIVEKAMEEWGKNLDSPLFQNREAAQQAILKMKNLAKNYLMKATRSLDSHKKYWAKKLLKWMEWEISPALIHKIGPLLQNYSRLGPKEKISRIWDLEKLGGLDGIPVLRKLLKAEKSLKVKFFIANSLFRLGDMEGYQFLERQKIQGIRDLKIQMILLYNNQGLKELQKGDYKKAAFFLKKALELDPLNKTTLYNLACVYSLWKKKEKAFYYLKKAILKGFHDVKHMQNDHDLDNIRKDPRFQELLKL
ncbi:MAG: tetratricopeptide repeat protein, partial [Planctomycetota bacterium]